MSLKSSSTRSSGLSETMLKLAAKKASLEAATRLMKDKVEMDKDEMITKQKREIEDQATKFKREQLDIRTEHAKISAELKVYAASEQGVLGEDEPSNFDKLMEACSIERHRIDKWVSNANELLSEGSFIDQMPAMATNEPAVDVDVKTTDGNMPSKLDADARDFVPIVHQPKQHIFTHPYAQEVSSRERDGRYVMQRAYDHNNASFMVDVMKESQQQQLRMIDMLQLPKVEFVSFSGEPLQYFTFMNAFDCNVDRAAIDPSQKLMRLIGLCKDDARRAIESCVAMEPASGYAEARRRLKELFGDNFEIYRAWQKKLFDGQKLGDYDSSKFREKADDIRNCYYTLAALNMLSQVDNQTTMLKILEKMPDFVKRRWLKRDAEIKARGGMFSFAEFVTFIGGISKEMNDSAFRELFKDKTMPLMSEEADQAWKRSSRRKGEHSFVTTGSRVDHQAALKSTRACDYCKAQHALHNCNDFKAISEQQRFEFVMLRKLCWLCLCANHMAKDCKKPLKCTVVGCGGNHSSLLHRDIGAGQEPSTSRSSAQVEGGQTTEVKVLDRVGNETNYATTANVSVQLPVVPVKVWSRNRDRVIETHALLDPCSTTTFCDLQLLNRLQAQVESKKLSLSTLEGQSTIIDTKVAELYVSDLDGDNVIKLNSVHARSPLHISSELIQCADTSRWPHLAQLNLPRVDSNAILLLIGQDTPEALWPLETRLGRKNEPYAMRTPLGWTVCGPVDERHHSSSSCFHAHVGDVDLESQVVKFWKLDDIAVYDHDREAMSMEDRNMIEILESSIQVVDGHYQMDIPFKERLTNLPDSRRMAARRLWLLGRKMDKDEKFAQQYTQEIRNMLVKGYAERIETSPDASVWYLPHHAVINVNKPKPRVVFDCAAKSDGISLNDLVMKGPDLLNAGLGVLLRFRCGPVAFKGDIEGMFNQVKVTPDNRNMMRFLFWPDDDRKEQPVEFRMCVHLFGGCWSPCAANFALRRVAHDFDGAVSRDVLHLVMRNFYVDDGLKACDSDQLAISTLSELREVLSRRGFHFTKCSSNRREVLEAIPVAERSQETDSQHLTNDSALSERSLGVKWCLTSDELGFSASVKDKPDTRRGALSTVASIYDPFGLASPFILPAKRLIQSLTRKQVDWDVLMPEDDKVQWHRWKNDVQLLDSLKVSRNIVSGRISDVVEFQLHHFCDASAYAYGAVSFVRATMADGSIECSFILAKSKLAPIRPVTIPRLELLAAVLAVKVDKVIRAELDIDIAATSFWSDSSIVLSYINSPNQRFKVFVANRLNEIWNATEVGQWFHVPSEQNAADDISRGLTAAELLACARWRKGPAFLWSGPDLEAMKSERLKLRLRCENSDPERLQQAGVYATIAEEEDIINRLIDKHSTWCSLTRGVMWLLRAVRKFKAVIHKKEINILSRVQELREASVVILSKIQHKCFGNVFAVLNSSTTERQLNQLDSVTKSVMSLDPFVNDCGLLCVGGRVKHRVITAEEQIVLPKGCRVVDLIIDQCHRDNMHVGREHVLALLRKSYWIVKPRRAVDGVLSRCMVCRKRRATPCSQKMADLPADRILCGQPPFTCTGVDYFGPLEVKQGRSTHKRYGCIFTCLSSRAVHIEVAYSLDTSSFICTLRRFIARRGAVRSVWSDNGTNFVGATNELKKSINALNQRQVDDFLVRRNIEWHFNPPAASHMGGAWERIIGIVRRVMRATVKDQRFTDESLSTLMCEIESLINDRPLTSVSSDVRDEEPLTPNHLLILRSGDTAPMGVFVPQDRYVKQRWRQVQYLCDVFWKRFLREYLPELQRRQKWLLPQRNVKIGDVVLLMESNVPRGSWPLGRIVKVYHGEDKLVRSADVKTRHGELQRPVTKMCLLEAAVDDSD